MKNSYSMNTKEEKRVINKLNKLLPQEVLFTIEDHIDLYLINYGANYRKYLLFFCLLLKDRGFIFTSCQIEDKIFDRLSRKNFNHFNLKGCYEIDDMSGDEFEVFLARFFKRCGFWVKRTPRSYDKGTDLIIHGDRSIVVQAKRWKKTVGIKAIQEVFTAREYHKADKAIVITSSKFSKSAIDCAIKLGVELWDRIRLFEELRRYNFKF
jgi:hypothetical protein